MNSAGYDLVVEIHRQLYNKILENVFERNPIIAKKMGLLSYELVLEKPPTVYRFNENRIYFTLDLKTKIRVLSKIKLNMKSRVNLIVAIQSDEISKKLNAELLESKLTPEPKEHVNTAIRQLSRLYYRLLTYLIDNRLSHHYEELALSSNLYSFILPELQHEGLTPIQMDVAKITSVNDDVVAILVNLLGQTYGSKMILIDYTAGQDIAFSLSANSIQRVKKHWWGNPDKPITDEVTGKLEIKPDLTLEILTRLGLALEDLIERHTLPINYVVQAWWLDYRIKAKLSEPEFVLREGNELNVPGLTIRLDIDTKLQLSIATQNEKAENKIITAITFTERDLELIIREASASIHIDNKLRIVARLVKLDTNFPLKWGLTAEILDLFTDRVEEHLIQMYSDIVVSPTIIREDIPGTGLHFNLDVSRIETSKDEITIGGSLEPLVT